MCEKKYMIDLPDPHRPGEFHSKGPMTDVEAREYLDSWGWGEHWKLFATELNSDTVSKGEAWEDEVWGETEV